MKFEGVLPALITPLHADETINVPVLGQLIEHFLTQGADGFYVGGATGEGLALKTEERMVLAEAAVKAINHRKPCIIQVAAADFHDAVALARQAEQCGADAISATPPQFFQYDEEDVYQYYKKLADSVHIPLMIYYNPAAGFHFNAKFAAKMFEVENITAIKWTSPNYYEMNRLKDLTHGEMNIMNGPDEMLLMGLNAGADGGIGTNYNLILDLIKSVYANFHAGNLAQAQQAQTDANRIISVMLQYKLIPAVKAVLEKQGFAVGDATFPMKRYSQQQKAQLFAQLQEVGFSV